MNTDPTDRWHDLGAFIREQRGSARLSLRHLSELAGISNPYLSQIERGLRRPSAEILQQIAKALRISAETLYVQAGILDPPEGTPDLSRAIMADQAISEDQKQALVRIYLSFRREFEEEQAQAAAAAARAARRRPWRRADRPGAQRPGSGGLRTFRRPGRDGRPAAIHGTLGVDRPPPDRAAPPSSQVQDLSAVVDGDPPGFATSGRR